MELLEKSVEALGGLDLLVNNAGVTRFENLLDMTPEVFDLLFNLDFKNYILMMQAAARYMVRHKVRGSLVNITSSRGERAYAGDFLYGGLKAGLNRAIQSIALDLAPYGIRVNNVAPGATRVREKEELETQGQPDFWDDLGRKIPLERCGTPQDMGEAVAFLASEKAAKYPCSYREPGWLLAPHHRRHRRAALRAGKFCAILKHSNKKRLEAGLPGVFPLPKRVDNGARAGKY